MLIQFQRPREENRQQEIINLTSEGKIPHEVELEKHPEKSPSGRMCRCPLTCLHHIIADVFSSKQG